MAKVSKKSLENLKKGNPATQFKTGREQVDIAKKGAEASNKARQRKKTLKEIADLLLSKKATPKTIKTILELYPDLNPEEITNDIAMTARQIEKAIKKADTRAYEVLQATIGEKPADVIETKEIPMDDEDLQIAKEGAKKLFGLVEKE